MNQPGTALKCRLCGSQSSVLKKSPGETFFSCRACGLAFLDKNNIPEDLGKYYSLNYYSDSYTGRNDTSVFDYRIGDIKKHIKQGGKILEIGSASGEFLKVLSELGYSVEGVELSSRAGNLGRSRYGLNIHIGDIFSAGFLNGLFDAVCMYHVIEHLENPKEVLKKIFNILKPEGVLIIETPNIKSIDCMFSSRLRESIFDVPNHTMLFPPKLLKNLLLESGFSKVISKSSFSFLISNLIRKKQSGKIDNMHISKTLESRVPVMSRDGVVKRILQRLFPGMKLTYIAIR